MIQSVVLSFEFNFFLWYWIHILDWKFQFLCFATGWQNFTKSDKNHLFARNCARFTVSLNLFFSDRFFYLLNFCINSITWHLTVYISTTSPVFKGDKSVDVHSFSCLLFMAVMNLILSFRTDFARLFHCRCLLSTFYQITM